MARVAEHFPYAVHVVPLHAWKSISDAGELWSKAERQRRGINLGRASSAHFDEVLGFRDHVHLYLSRSNRPEEIRKRAPILKSKLVDRRPPFPHVALLLDVRQIPHDDCTISCWNIGRSKPQVAGVPQVGGVLPGDTPEGMLDHWRRFRAAPRARRKGVYVEGLEVPVIPPRLYEDFEAHIPRDAKELLVASPLVIPADAVVWSLSHWDSQSLDLLGPSKWRRVFNPFGEYGEPRPALDPVAPEVREAIDEHFRGGPCPTLDYD